MSGDIAEGWRGSTLTAEVQHRPGFDLASIPPNAKVAANITTGGSAIRHFTGYVPPAERRKADPHVTRSTVSAADMIEARLRRKCMHYHCSYGGWPVDDAFEAMLNRGGVASANISVAADVSAAVMGSLYYLPMGSMQGQRNLQFSPDGDLVQALDQLTAVRGLDWGVNQNGVCFIRHPVSHTAGSYDYTLADDSANVEDIIRTFRATWTVTDFANLLIVMVGQGADAAAKVLIDEDSMSDSSASNFVGDVWSRFVALPDGDHVAEIANRLWEEIAYWHHLVQWTMEDRPEWMPDHEIRLQVDDLEITENSIVRITKKSWEAQEGTTGRYSQTLDAKVVEAA